MAGGAKKWFIGCGIGCGAVLLLVLGIGTVGYFGVKDAVNRGQSIEESFETLRVEYGRPGEFTPEPDGAVPPGRMEAFLGIRENMTAERKEIGDLLRTLDGQEVDGKKPGGFAKAKAGFKLIPGLMDFIARRSDAMLEGGMGLGEYLYIYSLAYPVLLETDLADGPGFTLSESGNDRGNDQRGFQWSVNEGDGESGDVREKRVKKIRRYLHGVQLSMARNQLAALEARGAGGEVQATALQAEIARMEAESLRLLWETDMPAAIRQSLEPYRDRLAAQYDPMVNLLESGLVEAD